MKNLSNALQFALDNNRQIALAFGCFDILHIGHISFISKIRQITSLPLCIGILPDFVIASSKGCNRPIIIEEQRAEIISSLKNVDMAFVLEKSKRIDTLSKEYELTDKELPLWSTAMCWLDTLGIVV